MNAISVTPTQVLAAVGVLLVLVLVWRAGSRRAKAATTAARTSVRLMSLGGRVVVNAVLIVIVQWVVVTHGGSGWLLFTVLGAPALLASYTLTKALMVTANVPRRRGGGRR